MTSLADLAVPLIALVALLLTATPSPSSPEAPMPETDPATGLEVPDATLGGPIPPDSAVPAPDPIAVPDSPPPPGTTNPDTGTDDGPTPTPTDDGMVDGETLLAARVEHGGKRDEIEKALASLNDQYSAIKADVSRDDAAIAAMLKDYPDGMYHTDPDGKLGVYTSSTAEPFYYVTHPVPATTRVRKPTA